MSKGSKIVTFRIPADLLAKVKGEIISHNHYSKGEWWKFSHFIIKAIEEKIAHAERSRKKKPKAKPYQYQTADDVDPIIQVFRACQGVIHPVAEKASEEKGMVIDDDRR